VEVPHYPYISPLPAEYLATHTTCSSPLVKVSI
jgi:hypothetical protein